MNNLTINLLASGQRLGTFDSIDQACLLLYQTKLTSTDTDFYDFKLDIIYYGITTSSFNVKYTDRLIICNEDNIISPSSLYPYLISFEYMLNKNNSNGCSVNVNEELAQQCKIRTRPNINPRVYPKFINNNQHNRNNVPHNKYDEEGNKSNNTSDKLVQLDVAKNDSQKINTDIPNISQQPIKTRKEIREQFIRDTSSFKKFLSDKETYILLNKSAVTEDQIPDNYIIEYDMLKLMQIQNTINFESNDNIISEYDTYTELMENIDIDDIDDIISESDTFTEIRENIDVSNDAN